MEEHWQEEPEAGQKGGAADAHAMAGAYPVTEADIATVRGIRWSGVLGGVFVALALTMLLVSLGTALGLTFGRFGTGGSLAYWIIGSAAVGLFLGSLLGARYGNITNVLTAIAHGIVIWSLFMVLDRMGVDLIGGISRLMLAVPAAASLAAGTTARDLVSAASWWFFIGYIIALVASILGAIAGLNIEEAEERAELHRRRA